MTPARLLIDPPLPGPANMARDEALLQTCVAPDAPPVLRFYAWSPATLSLGTFQDYADYERLPPPAGHLPVVRRTTGGGAILHDLELTYGLVLPAGHPLVRGRPNRLYELAHRAIIDAVSGGARLFGDGGTPCADPVGLRNLQSPIPNRQSSIRIPQPPLCTRSGGRRGPFFCFDRRCDLDVVVEDAHGPGSCSKLAGSAQRRTSVAILQHGSIMLDARHPQQAVATWSCLRGPIDFRQAAERLAVTFEKHLGVTFTRGAWRDEELQAAAKIAPRYAGAAWTVHRRRR